MEDPVSDPDFGPLEGFAFSGVNRFNKRCTGEVGSVFVDADAVPPFADPGYSDYVSDLDDASGLGATSDLDDTTTA